jgi:hypothetical protein
MFAVSADGLRDDSSMTLAFRAMYDSKAGKDNKSYGVTGLRAAFFLFLDWFTALEFGFPKGELTNEIAFGPICGLIVVKF